MVLWSWKRPKFSSKRSYFISQKSIEILPSTKTLANFYLTSSWQSLLTAIWFSRSLIFHPCHFAQLGLRKIFSRGLKNSRLLWNLLSFEKIRTTNIGKGLPNRNHEKISGQNQNFLKKENLEKYCPTHFVRTFLKRVYGRGSLTN